MEQRIRTVNQLTCDMSQVSNTDVTLHRYITFDFDPKSFCLLWLNDSLTRQFCDKKIVMERIFLKPNTFYLFHTLHSTIFGKQIIIQAKVQVKHESRRKIPTAAQYGQQGFTRADAFVGFSSGYTQTRLYTLFGTPFAFLVVLIRFSSRLQDYGLVLS